MTNALELLRRLDDAAPSVTQDERGAFEHIERASNLERDDEGDYVNPCVQSAWEGFQQGCAHARAASTSADVATARLAALKDAENIALLFNLGTPVGHSIADEIRKLSAAQSANGDTITPLFAAPPSQTADVAQGDHNYIHGQCKKCGCISAGE